MNRRILILSVLWLGAALTLVPAAARRARPRRPAAKKPPAVPASAMVSVRWTTGTATAPDGDRIALLVLQAGAARLEVPCPSQDDARRDGPRYAGRLALAAATRASLLQMGARPVGLGAALTWRGRILLTVSKAQARDFDEEPLETATRWAAALRKAAASTARPGALPRAIVMRRGGTRVVALPVAWIGADGLECSPPGVVRARLGANAVNLTLAGLRAGVSQVTLRHKDRNVSLDVQVRETAGALPAAVTVALTGRQPDAELAVDAVQRALEQASRPVPGAWLTAYWEGVGERLESGRTRVTAWLEGPGLVPVVAAVAASATLSNAEFARPAALAASNQPERLEGDRILLDTQLKPGNTVYYYHHQNAPGAPDRELEVRLENRSPSPATLAVTESGAGPSHDELYAGHLATWRYLRWMTRGNGWIVHLPAGASYALDRRLLGAGDVGCGMGQVMVLDGAPPFLVVEGLGMGPTDDDPTGNADAPGPRPTPAGDSVRGRGLYPTPERSLEATYHVGGPYTFISIGAPPYLQPLGDGTPNTGNYGVEHRVRIHLVNDTTAPERAYLVFAVGGGLARGSLLVDDRLVETPVLSAREGHREFDLGEYELTSGEVRDVNVLAFPEPGSNYPVRLVVKPLPANR